MGYVYQIITELIGNEHSSKLEIGSLTGYSRRHLIILETLAQSCQPSLDGGPLRQDRQKDRGKGLFTR